MIYLVTANSQLSDTESYKLITVEESLEKLGILDFVGLDTETEGLDPYTNKLLLLQLGCFDFQVVIDCRTIDPKLYKDFLESDREFLGWNLKFDLKFLYHQGIYPKRVYDGYLAEKLMWLGYPGGMHSMSLKSAGETYLSIELDKSVRGKIIWSKSLTDDIIIYGANDVKYLEQIKDKQTVELEKRDLLKAIYVENNFVFPLAYCEYCGIKLDIDKWKAKMIKDKDREEKALKACNKWLINNYPDCSYITVDLQGDLFSGFSTEPQVTLNWNSAKQLIPIFKHFGIELEVADKDKGGTKDSIDAKVLEPQKDKCDLIPIYLDYKEAVKTTSTYGENFLDQINPVSHRIHTNYSQMGADTTRITSGGDDTVNLLNLPSDEETRSCFVSEPGNKWISIDYSGQETYLMASIANDKEIINELTEGSGDMHSLVAKMVFINEIPRDFPVKDIKKQYHNLRQLAKGYEFLFNYGGNSDTIMRNFGKSKEEAEIIYNNYMSGFSGLRDYQSFRRKDWWDKGYILLSPVTGHKAYIYDYDILKKLESRLTYDFLREAKPFKGMGTYLPKSVKRQIAERFANGESIENLAKEFGSANAYRNPISEYFKRKSDSEKQSINYPIQASGSMCLRFSLIYFFNYLRKNNLFGKVKICVTPYDEVNCEAPEEIAEEVAQTLYECMVKAGAVFCTKCKLDADMSRLKDGTLPTYWIH